MSDENQIEDVEEVIVSNISEAVAAEDEKEDEVFEDIAKKPDNELINDYLRPNAKCIVCSTPIWSVKVNKAYLDGKSYSDIINEYTLKFEERTGRSLNKSLLHRHFNSHFDARAAAIAEYNKRRQDSLKSGATSTAQRDIFKLATNKYLDELEIFDTTAKEMITKYQELENIIEEKKLSSKTAGLDDLIIKQAQILTALNKQAISKFKALSKANLEGKQGQFLSQLSFIGSKAIAGVNSPKTLIDAKETEDLYLRVVIKQILARLEEPLKTFGEISVDQRLLFFRELKKSMIGIENGISADFDRQVKALNDQKLLSHNKKT